MNISRSIFPRYILMGPRQLAKSNLLFVPKTISFRQLSAIHRSALRSTITSQVNYAHHSYSTKFEDFQSQQESNSKEDSKKSEDSQKSQSSFQKVKRLFQKHGWVALLVYMGFSAIDFSVAFAIVWTLGVDQVKKAEDWVMGGILGIRVNKIEAEETALEAAENGEKIESLYSSIVSVGVLAYAIHKVLFMPIRVGLTIWVTPKVVKWLWNIGWRVGLHPTAAVAAATTSTPK